MTNSTAAAAVLLAAAVASGPVARAGATSGVDVRAGRAQPGVGAGVTVAVREVNALLEGKPGDTLRLKVVVTNTTAAAIPRLRWQLRLGAPLTSRSALGTPAVDATHALWPHDVDFACASSCIEELAAGTSHDIDLAIPAAELVLPAADRPTVYPLRVELTSRLYTPVGSADTFLVRFARGQRTLRVGWVVPITDTPRRDAFGVHLGDQLERSVATGGRLDRILAAVERAEQLTGPGEGRLALTLAVDAEVVEAVADMADGYVRAGRGATAEPEEVRANDDATRWLARLRQLTSRHAVLALPYADVDAVALVRAGLGTELAAAIDAGRRGLAAVLPSRPVETIAWPPDGVLDSSTLSVLASNRTDAVVLDESAVPAVAERTYTTTAAARLETAGRTLTALIADSRLAKLAGARPDAGGWPVTRQRLLAETAIIQQQRPSVPRDLVVPLPRLWSPTDIEWAAQLLAAPARAPWMSTATLPAVVAAEERADNRGAAPDYPDAARAVELSTAALRNVSRQRDGLMAFRALLAPTDNAEHLERAAAIKSDLDAAQAGLTRAQSAHWRGREGSPARVARQVRGHLDRLQDEIRVVFRKVTLTSLSGPVPITIDNGLGTPIEVRVRLHSPRAGLTFGQPADSFVIQPGQETIDVRFKAVTVGSFPVTVQLYNAEDRPIGASTTANVRTTAFGPVALVVTGVAFVLLVLAAGLRFLVRRRRRRNGTAKRNLPQPQPLEPVGSGPDPT